MKELLEKLIENSTETNELLKELITIVKPLTEVKESVEKIENNSYSHFEKITEKLTEISDSLNWTDGTSMAGMVLEELNWTKQNSMAQSLLNAIENVEKALNNIGDN